MIANDRTIPNGGGDRRRGVRGRTARALVTLLVAACAGGGLGAASAQAVVTAPEASQRNSIQFTAKTVVIDRGLARKYLAGVSKDHSTFKFKRAVGKLRQLRRGKVMLLKGVDAGKVTRVRRKKGRLIVTTRPAQLTELIRNGRLEFTGQPNAKKAFLSPIVTASPKSAAASVFSRPMYPYVGTPRDQLARAADAGLKTSGSLGNYEWELVFKPESTTKFNIEGEITYKSGGVTTTIKVAGFVEIERQSTSIRIKNGGITDSDISLKHIATSANVKYTVKSSDESGADGSPPVFKLPVSLELPVATPFGVPLYVKFQAELVLKLGLTSKGSEIKGGAEVKTDGAASVATPNGKTLLGSGPLADAVIFGKEQVGPSRTGLPAAVVIAFKIPKIAVGLGIPSANALGYFDVITTVTQRTGHSLLGVPCSAFELEVTGGAGFEGQLGPIPVELGRTTLFTKKGSKVEPGC